MTSESAARVSVASAAAAAPVLAGTCIKARADLLRDVAHQLDHHRAELVKLGHGETELPPTRLDGEITRTTGQLGLLADVITEGSWLEATIDQGPPDVRRVNVPLGPVVNFAASNFPFAFSVAGGDTASALASGCPVIVKTHEGHPHLSAAVAEILVAAVRDAGLPDGTFDVISGVEAGVAVLRDTRIRAGAFTGSERGGRALLDIAAARDVPIPFYAEMGSLNPVVVTRRAAAERPAEIATGFVESMTLGVGQFCTKPGFLFVPADSGIADLVTEAVAGVPPGRMLMPRMLREHERIRGELAEVPGMRSGERASTPSPGEVAALVLRMDASALSASPQTVLRECFGPTSVIVEYQRQDEVLAALEHFGGNLTATVHAGDGEVGAEAILQFVSDLAGRVVWNGWPTGVAVNWAMHHGGPYPATSWSAFTAVGAGAVKRFVRPVAYQDVPDSLLPPALQRANPMSLPRRIDGRRVGG